MLNKSKGSARESKDFKQHYVKALKKGLKVGEEPAEQGETAAAQK